MSRLDTSPITAADLASASLSGFRARLLDRLLAGIDCGRLTIELPTGRRVQRVGRDNGPEAAITIHRWRLLRRLLASGDIGFAEGFIAGDWSSPDLVALIRLAARNTEPLKRIQRGSPLFRLANRLRHARRANTRRGSRRNIEAHYDLGNDFYRLWLDRSMLYSSGLYDDGTTTLEAAQQAKLARIRQLLQLRGGERVLEIGCGWGALAVHLAERAGAHVTGITLSPSQLAFAQDVASASPAAGHIALRLQDYRDLSERFDRIASIEMFEAVGRAWWPTYFAAIRRSLKSEGCAVLQVITIAEERFEDYLRDTDFIQKHIFPGGLLPSKTAFAEAAAGAELRVERAEHFGLSYAETLAEWRLRFQRSWPLIAAQGFDERFHRLWTYYLAYCEAGFREGAIDVGLYVLRPAGEA
jgi:cyclopropane-fatty-acyl-phospholipid synthase